MSPAPNIIQPLPATFDEVLGAIANEQKPTAIVVPAKPFLKWVGGKQYGRHVLVGPSIYESPRIVDFLVINKDKFPDGLVIECKWQESGGSVDEKYPFLCYNIYRTGVPTIILLDGGGYRKAAETWLRGQAGEDRAVWKVWNLMEFMKATNAGLLD